MADCESFVVSSGKLEDQAAMFTLGIRRWLPVYFFTCGVAVWCVGGALAAEEDAAHGDAAAAEVHDGDFHASGAGDGAADHGDASGGHGEGEHGEGAGNPLPVDPDLAIATFIIFLLLMAILWKFAWGPIRDALDSREKGIAGQLAEAARSNEEARRMLAEHEQRLAGAAAEVRSMLDQAKAEAESQKNTIISEAQQAAAAEKDRALRAIESAKNGALRDVAEKSVDTAVNLAGRIVRRQLSGEDHGNLIREALDKLPSEN